MELNRIDANTAALNDYEIGYGVRAREDEERDETIADVVRVNVAQVTAQDINDLFERDDSFANQLCSEIARLIQTGSSLRNVFQDAVRRQVEDEYDRLRGMN